MGNCFFLCRTCNVLRTYDLNIAALFRMSDCPLCAASEIVECLCAAEVFVPLRWYCIAHFVVRAALGMGT